jgi:hypothetical protein
MTRYSKTEINESLECLRTLLPPGSTVFTIVRSVSRSGMSRQISLFARGKDGDLTPISAHAARVLGWPMKREWHDSIRVDGCGMDMCFHAVMALSYALHGTKDHGAAVGHESPAGWPWSKTTPEDYRAGYSLTYRDL